MGSTLGPNHGPRTRVLLTHPNSFPFPLSWSSQNQSELHIILLNLQRSNLLLFRILLRVKFTKFGMLLITFLNLCFPHMKYGRYWLHMRKKNYLFSRFKAFYSWKTWFGREDLRPRELEFWLPESFGPTWPILTFKFI
jgi:hypothetical protein